VSELLEGAARIENDSGYGQLKMAMLLGDKEGIKAPMQYILAMGRLKKEVE
jgi:hypothetical protein